MAYLVTGGCGFLGSNIAATLLREGERVTVFDSLRRERSAANAAWLITQGKCEFVHGDIRNSHDVESVIKRLRPNVVFHLAGQVAMTTSLTDPRHDYETNVSGSLNLLEGVREYCPNAAVVYSSSNKVYGSLMTLPLCEEETRYAAVQNPAGLDERTPLDFHTPYGCSKGAADQYMLDYARSFGLNTVVFRHSTIYGSRQFSTFDQGWVGWFCRQAIETKANPKRPPFTISGNGKQVRDLLFVDDAVCCYRAAARQIDQARGQAFNIGGGIDNSLSLLELLRILESKLEVELCFEQIDWRKDDQKFFVADISRAKRLLGWEPLVGKELGIDRAIEWVVSSM